MSATVLHATKKVLGDEYHLLIECTNQVIAQARHRYLPKFLLCRPSVAKCTSWIHQISIKDEISLGKFLVKTLEIFK